MPITINGSGTVTGISAGGLPDGVITTDDIAAGAATTAKLTGGPAFSAYNNASQTITNFVGTKVILNTKEFDTASAFDSTTNYRFQPTIAGYYQFNAVIRPVATTSINTACCQLHKNGSALVRGSEWGGATTTVAIQLQANYLVYLNGTSDYIELYTLIVGSGTLSLKYDGIPFTSRLSGFLARPA
jgi:hypothetical protein